MPTAIIRAYDLAAQGRCEQALVGLVNYQRHQAGLPPLIPDARLGAAAIGQAADCATRGALDHRGADGTWPADRLRRMAVADVADAEDAAAGQVTPEQTVADWMASPGHRAAILGDSTHFGAGFCDRVEGGTLTRFWIADFAKIPE